MVLPGRWGARNRPVPWVPGPPRPGHPRNFHACLKCTLGQAGNISSRADGDSIPCWGRRPRISSPYGRCYPPKASTAERTATMDGARQVVRVSRDAEKSLPRNAPKASSLCRLVGALPSCCRRQQSTTICGSCRQRLGRLQEFDDASRDRSLHSSFADLCLARLLPLSWRKLRSLPTRHTRTPPHPQTSASPTCSAA